MPILWTWEIKSFLWFQDCPLKTNILYKISPLPSAAAVPLTFLFTVGKTFQLFHLHHHKLVINDVTNTKQQHYKSGKRKKKIIIYQTTHFLSFIFVSNCFLPIQAFSYWWRNNGHKERRGDGWNFCFWQVGLGGEVRNWKFQNQKISPGIKIVHLK